MNTRERLEKAALTKATKAAEFAEQTISINDQWRIIRADELNWEIQKDGKFYGYYGHLLHAFQALPLKMLDSAARGTLADLQERQKAICETITKALNMKLAAIIIAFMLLGWVKTAECSGIVNLTNLGGQQSVSMKTGSSGHIVGWYVPDGEHYAKAFLYNQGTFTDINPPNSSESYANDVNASGVVCGTYRNQISGYMYAFTYVNGTFYTLPDFSGIVTSAESINDAGQIVGLTYLPANRYGLPLQTAFIYTNGIVYNLNSFLPANSGWELVDATKIDQNGHVSGSGKINGITRGYMLSLLP